MNESSFKEAAERYRNEMIKLYGTKPEPVPESVTEAEPEVIPEPEPEQTEIPEETEKLPEQTAGDEDDIEKKYPPPEIPVFMQTECGGTRPHPEAVINYDDGQTNTISKSRESEMPDYNIENPPDHSETPVQTEPSANPMENTWGYLKVTVRTGSNGIPVPNASVTITRRYDGKEEMVRFTTTDRNGDTETFRLSAPPQGTGNTPQDFEHYSVYDAAVFAKGYYREVSRNIPIFEGITSIQGFNLIPEPYSFDSGGNYISYGNQEPEV